MGVRLEIGLPYELGDLASELGASMTRIEYLSLLVEASALRIRFDRCHTRNSLKIIGGEAAKLVRITIEASFN